MHALPSAEQPRWIDRRDRERTRVLRASDHPLSAVAPPSDSCWVATCSAGAAGGNCPRADPVRASCHLIERSVDARHWADRTRFGGNLHSMGQRAGGQLDPRLAARAGRTHGHLGGSRLVAAINTTNIRVTAVSRMRATGGYGRTREDTTASEIRLKREDRAMLAVPQPCHALAEPDGHRGHKRTRSPLSSGTGGTRRTPKDT